MQLTDKEREDLILQCALGSAIQSLERNKEYILLMEHYVNVQSQQIVLKALSTKDEELIIAAKSIAHFLRWIERTKIDAESAHKTLYDEE